MKEIGLRSVVKRKVVITTGSKHPFPIANNQLNRNFSRNKLGQK